MSALTVDALALLIAGHEAVEIWLTTERLAHWCCKCGHTGGVDVSDAAVMRPSLSPYWADVRSAHNRHLAEVIFMAQKIANRGDDPIGADELAEQYYDRAGRILNITGFDGCGSRMGVELFWHIDTDLIVTMLNAGRMTVVETGVYELRGLPVRGHEADGDLDGDAPVFALVIQ